MSTPSAFSSQGLSLVISVPFVQGSEKIGTFSDEIASYSHTITSSEGFSSANFTMIGNHEFLENWLEYGLGRHVQVYGPSQRIIWEGYVNQVDVNMGTVTFAKGPLSDIANRVSTMYTELLEHCPDLTVDPDCKETGEPIVGEAKETLIDQDLDSQNRYGIWEKILNLGEAWPSDAEEVQDLYLYENAWPAGNPSISISGGGEGELSVKISCRGYIDWLTYPYNNPCDPHVWDTLTNVIKDILSHEPNGIISPLYDQMQENDFIIDTFTNENKLAKTLIDDYLAYGSGNYDRWTFGIYANRKISFAAIPTEVEYIYYRTGNAQQVETLRGGIVEPWNVVPCKWAAIPVFLASFSPKIGDIRNDPRVFFVEEVNFTAPDQISLTGAKVRRLSQLLTQLGLGSV